MYANAMYHTTIGDRIRKSHDGSSTLEQQISALEGQSSTSAVALTAGIALALASTCWSIYNRIANEARPQVADAIAHTGYIQVDLEQVHRSQSGRWPRGAQELKLIKSAQSAFVESIDVADGDIRMGFSDNAAFLLRDKVLVMKPIISNPGRYDWVCDRAASSVPTAFWPDNCDTREMNPGTSLPAPQLSSTIRHTSFASGKASVPLSKKFQVTVDGDSLTATFGANQDHKLEMTLVDRLRDSDPVAQFVHAQAAKSGTKAYESGDRVFFDELGDDIRIDGRNHEVTHWQVGAANCVFTVTLTTPLPSTTDYRDFMYDDQQVIL